MDKDSQIEGLQTIIELQNEAIEALNSLTSELWRIVKTFTLLHNTDDQ